MLTKQSILSYWKFSRCLSIGFDRVLDFLRSGEMILENVDDYIITKIKDHLDYFQLPVPEVLLGQLPIPEQFDPWAKENCSRSVAINGRSITKTGIQGVNC